MGINNIVLRLVTESYKDPIYEHLAGTSVDILSSTIRGYILPKQSGSQNSLLQFMDACFTSFVVLDPNFYKGWAGFLPQIDPISRDASLFIFLTHEFTRKNKEAPEIVANFLVNYAFSKLGMHRVSISVLENDQQLLDTFHAIGFTQEGIKRKAHWADGAWLDVYIFGVIDEEWKKLNEGKGAED